MERPQKITKLAFYLMDKEPLFYLFIINTDFILDEVCFGSDYAAVLYKNGRVNFHYTEKFINLPIKKLYFILIHEAYHIFKRHLMIHTDLKKENFLLLNIAEDAIINTEISESKFIGIHPSYEGLEPIFIPDEYKRKYNSIGKDAYVSPRLFNWYKSKKEDDKRNILNKVRYCKNTKSGEYGRIDYQDSEESFAISVFEDGIDGVLKDNSGHRDKNAKARTGVPAEDLIPVFVNSNDGSYHQGTYNGEMEVYGFFDSHEQLYEEPESPDPISQQVFVQKIIKQAREMVDNNPQLKKHAGNKNGNSILEKLESLIKPEVSWKKIFKKQMNLYYSNNSITKSKKKSIITYLMNAKSRYGFIFRHWMKVKNKLQRYVFVAVDTSGSCFSDKYDMERFFAEIDSISEELEFSNSGKVFVMQWDWGVADDWKQYHKGDWKHWEIKGGGGTNPNVIFNHMNNTMKKVGHHSLVHQLEKDNPESILFIPDKNKMPFLIILTDGYFYGRLRKEDLGYYEKNTDNILFVTKSEDSLYEGARSIRFK